MLACASLTGALAATTYTLTDLGTGAANDINSSGKVVGNDGASPWYYDGTTRTKLPVIPTLVLQPLPGEGTAPVTPSVAWAINDNGRIIGEGFSPGPPPQPGQPPINFTGFIYDGSGTGIMVGDYGVHGPYGVNSGGTVVGNQYAYVGTDTVPLAGFLSVGRSVNTGGLIVGKTVVGGGPFFKACTFSASTSGSTYSWLDVSAVEGLLGSQVSSEALSVNSSGQLVGYAVDASFSPTPKYSLPFLYANGSAIGLGSLGGVQSMANDINNAGVVVGSSMVPDGTPHAFVFVNSQLSDLNSLVTSGAAGWVFTYANAINDDGVIVGQGLKDGVAHAFLLRPTANNIPPAISAQPLGGHILSGAPLALSVTASGPGTLTYQWKHAGTNLPGAITNTYTVASATLADAGNYQVLVSNSFGTTASDNVSVEVSILQSLQLSFYAGITVTGTVGQNFRIESVEAVGNTNWQTLATVTLSTTSFLWVDADSPQHPHRFYRAVLLP